MAEFKSLADLFKSVNKDIDQALDSGVSDYVTQVAISYAKQRVYNRYRIHYERKSRPHYVRRKSLLQEENWNSELVSQPAIEIGVSNHTVAIYNTAKPNKVLNDKGEAANNTDEIQSLPELIELGQKNIRKNLVALAICLTIYLLINIDICKPDLLCKQL